MRWQSTVFMLAEAAISYVVTTTSKAETSASSSLRMSSRSSRSPECRRTTRMVGAKRLNSLTQLESTESGATMSEGPCMPHSNLR